MVLPPSRPLHATGPADRLASRIGIARTLALSGATVPARSVCAAIVLEDALLLAADRSALRSLVECLLLLEMIPLLARTLRALHGVTLAVTPLQGAAPRRRLFTLNGDLSLVVLAPGLHAPAPAREAAAAQWSAALLHAAALVGAPRPDRNPSAPIRRSEADETETTCVALNTI